MGEAPSKYGIDTTTIKGFTNYNVIFSLVSNMSLIKARCIRVESMGLEIYDNIPIRRIK